MGQIEPGDREEMLLQGILNGDPTTNIEPGSRKEMLLKAILENGGGLPEVTSADNGKVLGVVDGEWAKMLEGMPVVDAVQEVTGHTYRFYLSLSADNDFLSSATSCKPFRTKSYWYSTTRRPYDSIWLPVFLDFGSGGRAVKATVLRYGEPYQSSYKEVAMTVKYLERIETNNEVRYYIYKEWNRDDGFDYPISSLSSDFRSNAIPQEWWDNNKSDAAQEIASLIPARPVTQECGAGLALFFGLIVQTYLVPLASANPDTWFAYYVPVTPGETDEMVSSYLTNVSAARTAGKIPVFGNNYVITGEDTAPVVNMVVPDFTNHKIMEYYLMVSSTTIMFKFICHEAQLYSGS